MRIKIFYGRSRQDLEQAVNTWLSTHAVSPATMHFQFSTVSLEDETQFILEHTLVVFYVPMERV